jgi:hypothetical protein
MVLALPTVPSPQQQQRPGRLGLLVWALSLV